jgi:hypothetical protein
VELAVVASAAVLQRRLALSLVVLAAVVLAAAGCADQSAAIEVGDQSVSESDLQDMLAGYAGNEAWTGGATDEELAGDSPRSWGRPLVDQVLVQTIYSLFVEEQFEQADLELTDADISSARGEIEADAQAQEILAGFPDLIRDQVIETQARSTLLAQSLGQSPAEEGLIELVSTTDVELSSRYGSFDRQAFLQLLVDQQGAETASPILPPAGPAPNPEADETDEADQGSAEIPAG